MAQTKIITLENLSYYDGKIKNYIDAADARSLKTVAIEGNVLKFYRVDEPVGETAPAYEITLPETDLSELMPKLVGATSGNVVIVNEDGTTVKDSGVAVADLATKDEVEAVDDKADKNAEDIATINNAETGLLKQAKDYADGKDASIAEAKKAGTDAQATADKNAEDIVALQGRMTTAEGDIDAVETDMGDVDSLSTTNKTVVGAINEVLAAVGTGGTAAVVTMTTDTTSEGAVKSYTFKQGETTIGVIDIPKDMVVESGEVVTNPEGQAEGTYIKLVLANVAEPLYINVGTLVDIYKAKADATQIQLAIDSSTREISATIVAGSVGTTELADNAVTTVKIADANVTLAKLSTSVQASLAKADAAASQTALDEEVARAKAAEAQALTDAKAYANEKVAAEKERAEGVEAGLEERLADVESQLGTGEGSVDEKIATAKQEAIDVASADATTKANVAETNAKAHADTEIAKTNVNVTKNAEDITALTTRVDTAETDIDNLEKSLAEGGATANAIAEAKKAGTDAQADVDALVERVSANETNIGGHADRLTALESKVGDGFVAAETADIDAMFE